MEYLDTVSELNYLTQIVIMLYEDSSEKEDSEKRFHVELHFSPGAYGCFDVQSEVCALKFIRFDLPVFFCVFIFRMIQIGLFQIQLEHRYRRVIVKQHIVHRDMEVLFQ